jgi:hypothetical protein
MMDSPRAIRATIRPKTSPFMARINKSSDTSPLRNSTSPRYRESNPPAGGVLNTPRRCHWPRPRLGTIFYEVLGQCKSLRLVNRFPESLGRYAPAHRSGLPPAHGHTLRSPAANPRGPGSGSR